MNVFGKQHTSIFFVVISVFICVTDLASAGVNLPVPAGFAVEMTDSFIPFRQGQSPTAFVPLTLDDLSNPASGGGVGPDDIVMVEIRGRETVATASELLDQLNAVEQKLSQVGKSLRNEKNTVAISRLANPDIWMREVRTQLNVNLDALIDTFKLGQTQCQIVKVEDLGSNPATDKSWSPTDAVRVPNQPPIPLADLLFRLNNEQRQLCQSGNNLYETLSPKSASFIDDVLARRNTLRNSLHLDASSAASEITNLAKSLAPDAAAKEFARIEEAVKTPSPEKLYSLAQKGVAPLSGLVLPDIPSFPAPNVTKRTNLHLKKHFEWPGFSVGNQAVAGAYGNAWAELRSGSISEPAQAPATEQSFQAAANIGLYLLNSQINLLGAVVDSKLDPNNAIGKSKYCYFDVCSTKEAGVSNFGVSANEPALLDKAWDKSYEQQLVVGIVPVVIRIGAKFDAKMGWNVGLNLLSASGGINGNVNASAKGEAAAGIEDFVEAGCGGEVSLIKDSLVINGDASIKFLADEQPTMEVNITGDNVVSSLDGRIYAYAMINALGPIGVYLDRIVSTLQDLGDGQLSSFLDRIGDKSQVGKKLVSSLNAAHRDIGSAFTAGAEGLHKVFGGCCKFSAVPVLPGSVPFGAMTLSGANIRYEQDWFSWHGNHSSTRFLNYRLYIGPDGKEYGGDLGSYDSDETSSLAEREAELVKAEIKAAALRESVLADARSFIRADNTRSLDSLPKMLESESKLRIDTSTAVFKEFLDL